MAAEVVIGGLVGEAVAKLSDAIIDVIKKPTSLNSDLIRLQQTINRIRPIYNEIAILNRVLNRPQPEIDFFISQLKAAEDLVRKCEHIGWNFFKMYWYSCKLADLNASLLRFFQMDAQLLQIRDLNDLLVTVKDVPRKMVNWSSGGVPLMKGAVIGFESAVWALRAMVLKDSAVDDCSVVVVSAAGGCGKTTLVTMLCHDDVIQGTFGKNIYFATVSNTPNLKVIIKNLLQKNQAGQQLDFSCDEDAIHQWGNFLGEKNSKILLVLDDVWSDTIINDFKFKLYGYKILVTSRNNYDRFETYKLQVLKHQDATALFHHSAFSECGSERTDIPDDLVNKLVESCKKNPLALCVIGGSLKGKHVAVWKGTLKKLSEGHQSIFDLHKDMLLRLEKSLDVLDEKSAIMQCYLDLGLFPEDQKIAATTLMDMWVHLYKHDEEGLLTLNKLFELSAKNLINLSPIRKDSTLIANYCEEKTVMQHDMLRELALYISNRGPIEQRKRLIINACGEDLPDWTKHLQKTIRACLLSISTDERFALRWNDMQVPEVEVLVLNFISEVYALPQFVQQMDRLKVLIITNYGFYFTKLNNFPAPRYLSSLTSLRLEHISISSVSQSILELVNLQKLSLITCQMGNSFEDCFFDKLPRLLEIDLASCHDLVTFPAAFCNVSLKKLIITDCHELSSLSEGFGKLTNIEVLRLASCSNLTSLPESILNLQKLSVIDISYSLRLRELPVRIGELCSLRTIHMKGCTGLLELPQSFKNLCPLEVVCDEEIFYKWSDFRHVKINLVEEDNYKNLLKIIS